MIIMANIYYTKYENAINTWDAIAFWRVKPLYALLYAKHYNIKCFKDQYSL